MMENSDRLQVEGKPISDNMNRLPGETGLESEKTEPISGKIEPEPGGKIGLREEAKPTLVKKFQEESVTKQDEVEKDQSPLDEGKTKPISKDDSVTRVTQSGQIGGHRFWSALKIPDKLRIRRLSGKF
jgi:hypothetical protein